MDIQQRQSKNNFQTSDTVFHVLVLDENRIKTSDMITIDLFTDNIHVTQYFNL